MSYGSDMVKAMEEWDLNNYGKRKNLNVEDEPVVETTDLGTLIDNYAESKRDLDDLKKDVDKYNANIKQMMAEIGVDKYDTGLYTASVTESTRESVNEEKLLAVMKKYGLNQCVRTIEVVDMDALEQYMYNNVLTVELADDIDKCRNVTPVVTLRVKKSKQK